jgi:hypothetical protein
MSTAEGDGLSLRRPKHSISPYLTGLSGLSSTVKDIEMKKIAIVLATLAGLFAAMGGAEAQRARGSLSGAEWGTYSFQSEQYPQARTYRSSSRSARTERSATRSARTARSTRATRSARRGRASSGLELASLTGGSGAGPRPGAWCGWWMRTQLGGGPAYNLAWNWRNYGSPSSAHVGAVVVWRHHVGMITGQASNGQWIVKSGNDGGRVRERARSVAGAIFRA